MVISEAFTYIVYEFPRFFISVGIFYIIFHRLDVNSYAEYSLIISFVALSECFFMLNSKAAMNRLFSSRLVQAYSFYSFALVFTFGMILLLILPKVKLLKKKVIKIVVGGI